MPPPWAHRGLCYLLVEALHLRSCSGLTWTGEFHLTVDRHGPIQCPDRPSS